jgi:hypothetical protein
MFSIFFVKNSTSSSFPAFDKTTAVDLISKLNLNVGNMENMTKVY